MWLIRGYQFVSRRLPPTCRYRPTCSEYTRQAVEMRGAWRGLGMGMLRILRCHPFARGGYDPVPGFDEGKQGDGESSSLESNDQAHA